METLTLLLAFLDAVDLSDPPTYWKERALEIATVPCRKFPQKPPTAPKQTWSM